MPTVKSALRKAPARLRKRGGFWCFCSDTRRFKGITKALGKLNSKHDPPTETEWRGAWRGEGGGRRRGSAVDKQVAKVVNGRGAATFSLTKLVFGALKHHGLKPVVAQRVVVDERSGFATAADLVAVDGEDLVLVELKTGYPGDRTRCAMPGGKPAMMRGPVSKAQDTTTNRHFAQLAVTLHMFQNETATFEALQAAGVKRVKGVVLYVDTGGSEVFPLPGWWSRRAGRILDSL